MTYEARILVAIEAESPAAARELALEAARQVELRLGAGPHSVAPWVPALGDEKAHVLDAELEVVVDADAAWRPDRG